MEAQNALADLIPPPVTSAPATPQPAHASIPGDTATATSHLQRARTEGAKAGSMTPPPSAQPAGYIRAKTRTPTPTFSHISTPPPTIEAPMSSLERLPSAAPFTELDLSPTAVATASAEDLRSAVSSMRTALHEAKMSAAHYRLQYQMLSKESAAAIERMAVEARMAQSENDVIHVAEQARAAAAATTPVQPTPPPMLVSEGTILVQKDLYQKMCREIQNLAQANNFLELEHTQQEKLITKQEIEIASLTDKVTLMRERIRENREHLQKMRQQNWFGTPQPDATPSSTIYTTPTQHRNHRTDQNQPFAALLQASEMASSQEARRRMDGAVGKKGHTRNIHSMSSLPATPVRDHTSSKHRNTLMSTPQGRQPPVKVPATAPAPRTSAFLGIKAYGQQSSPMQIPGPSRGGPPSEGTVSASDRGDDDSEAETDILSNLGDSIEDDTETVAESFASRTASQMLRPSQEDLSPYRAPRNERPKSGGLKQARLFGAVTKEELDRRHIGERSDEGLPPMKRARVDDSPRRVVGLGIAGVRD